MGATPHSFSPAGPCPNLFLRSGVCVFAPFRQGGAFFLLPLNLIQEGCLPVFTRVVSVILPAPYSWAPPHVDRGSLNAKSLTCLYSSSIDAQTLSSLQQTLFDSSRIQLTLDGIANSTLFLALVPLTMRQACVPDDDLTWIFDNQVGCA